MLSKYVSLPACWPHVCRKALYEKGEVRTSLACLSPLSQALSTGGSTGGGGGGSSSTAGPAYKTKDIISFVICNNVPSQS